MNIYLEKLYKLAKKAYKNGDIPVSALIIKDGKIIATGYNNRHRKSNVLGHAEVNAILKAERYIKDFRLNECIMITTLKPCFMCSTIIKEARIKEVYYILDQKRASESYPQVNLIKMDCKEDPFFAKYKQLFNDFFQKIR